MSNKTLLNESQVRQFMKLAKLEPLASGFVEGLTSTQSTDEMEESHGRGKGENPPHARLEEEAPPHELEMDAADDLGDDSLEGDEEAAHDELEADMEMAPEAPADEGRMISVDDFLGALETALETAMGDEVEIDATEMSDEEDEVEADVEMDAADDMELDTDMEMDDEMLAEEEKEQGADDREDERLGAKDGKESGKKQSMKDRRKEMRGARRADDESGDPVPTQEGVEATDALVEQITKRVAARILKSALAKK